MLTYLFNLLQVSRNVCLTSMDCHKAAFASHGWRSPSTSGGLLREIMMGEGNQVASATLFTFTKRPGPLAHIAWAVIG